MATQLFEDFELGTDGAAVTTSNSQASVVTPGTNNQIRFDDTYADEDLGIHFNIGTTNSSIAEWPLAAAQAGRCVGRFENFLYLNGVSWRFSTVRNSDGTTTANAGHLNLGATGLLSLLTSAGSATTTSSVSAAALAPNTQYDIEFAITPGTTTTNGVLEFRYYLAGSATPIETKVVTGQNTGLFPIRNWRAGSNAVIASAQEFWFDNLKVQDLATGWIGPATNPPVLNTAVTYDKAILDARGSTAGSGGTLSYAISPSTGVVALSAGLWAVPRGVTYTVTVTEAGTGLTDNAPTVTVTPAAATSTHRILAWNGTAYV